MATADSGCRDRGRPPGVLGWDSVESSELLSKLDQIEEHARLTLFDFPSELGKDRQRMIIALIKYLRTEFELAQQRAAVAVVRESSARVGRTTGSG